MYNLHTAQCDVWFSPSNSPKPKYVELTNIYNKETHQDVTITSNCLAFLL